MARDAEGAVADEVGDVHRRPHRRQASRYWPKLCQRRSSEAPMPPAHPFTTSSCPGASGAWEKEHMPTTSVVTPWRTFDSADGHAKVEEVGVRVSVDEARRHGLPGGVDHPLGFTVRWGRDRRDAIALHRDVGGASRRAASVDDRPASNQQRPGHGQASTMTTDFIRSPC